MSVDADSFVTIDPATLAAGLHTLSISYINSDTSVQFSLDFNIQAPVTPRISLTSNISVVTNLQIPVTIDAKNVSGGGAAPVYTFARNKAFSDLVQPASTQNLLTIQPITLKIGDNQFYVRMQTSESCFTTNAAIDSINIRRSEVTGIIDPENPGQIIIVAPNPFADEIVVRGLSSNVAQLSLFDVTGRLLMTAATRGQSFVRLKPQMANSIYYLVIYNRRKQQLGVIKLLKRPQ